MVRPITIDWAANGWTATIGCQRFVFESRTALLNRLAEYLESPEAAEKNATVWAQNMKFTQNNPAENNPVESARNTLRQEYVCTGYVPVPGGQSVQS